MARRRRPTIADKRRLELDYRLAFWEMIVKLLLALIAALVTVILALVNR
jgi:hypothetical protein